MTDVTDRRGTDDAAGDVGPGASLIRHAPDLRGAFIGSHEPLTLVETSVGAWRTESSLEQVGEWFRGLGHEVPDVAGTLRETAPLIPRRG
ncbi:hypothetical protein [Nocardiopsis sp. MG754419]|uniref:hypothetical protein n=1 Tax=Nocardiopsis sp. MG754419 TaxID=2259865 RepID=UPI001BA827E9|nr:hypothetical protein [Nocardiopsis sp. MG754419]MBR8743126.1 hypothetical protein [Nocardiopsis sp. MG754419]